MKKIIALLLMIVMLMTTVISAFASDNFNDISGHWAESDIEKAFASGIVNGDGDGSFRPDDTITRAEYVKMFIAMVSDVFDMEIPSGYGNGSHWVEDYYIFGLQTGAIAIDEESTVKTAFGEISPGVMDSESADMNIERWEMAFMTSNMVLYAMQYDAYVDGNEHAFSDMNFINTYPDSVRIGIELCAAIGIIKGDENGAFSPADCGTRAETVVIVNRMKDVLEKVKVKIDEQEEAALEAQEAAEKEVNDKLKTYTDAEIPDKNVKVKFTMENGKSFTMELYPEFAPQTVANFVSLVKSGFYDGLTFHRVVDDFMAQGGDPNGNGTGGAENYIYGEFAQNGWDKNTLSHTEGVVSMARSSFSANSASSQFFICYSDDCTFLDGQYAAFGKVIDGMDNVKAFLEVEREMGSDNAISKPKEPIVIKSARVID